MWFCLQSRNFGLTWLEQKWLFILTMQLLVPHGEERRKAKGDYIGTLVIGIWIWVQGSKEDWELSDWPLIKPSEGRSVETRSWAWNWWYFP